MHSLQEWFGRGVGVRGRGVDRGAVWGIPHRANMESDLQAGIPHLRMCRLVPHRYSSKTMAVCCADKALSRHGGHEDGAVAARTARTTAIPLRHKTVANPVSPHTESFEIKAMDCGPNHELIPVVRLPICIRNRLFLQRGEITDSTAYRSPPVPFPEGELLVSPGFAAQRLPWVRDIHVVPEP